MLPVRLRLGGRSFGGVMSWGTPAAMAPFDPESPFAGLPIPPDVTVTRQVLAEPGPDLAAKTWARLADGTPLVTAVPQGAGWLILVHTTANADWSNLPLSGLFVDMLRRILALSQGITEISGDLPLAPFMVLDGFGRLSEPPAIAAPVPASSFQDTMPGPRTPPGYYGTELSRRAFNLGPKIGTLAPLLGRNGGGGIDIQAGTLVEGYERDREIDLKPWLLTAAFFILLADFIIGLILRGLAPRLPASGTMKRTTRKRAAMANIAILLAGLAIGLTISPPGSPQAQPIANAAPESFAIDAAGRFRLAYIVTGDGDADRISADGLRGLGQVLNARTSIEPVDPVGLNINRDELAFFSLIYWRMVPNQAPLDDVALERLNIYLRNGGMIFFDTADQQFASSGGGSPGVENAPRAGRRTRRAALATCPDRPCADQIFLPTVRLSRTMGRRRDLGPAARRPYQ